MGGLGLRAAEDHAQAAYAASNLSCQTLVQQLLHNPLQDNEQEIEAVALRAELLDGIKARLDTEVEVTTDYLYGQTQRQISATIDLSNQESLSNQVQASGDEREVARLKCLSLPHSGDWLNCSPIASLGLRIPATEFILMTKYRLGMQVFASEGPCPACSRHSDQFGDHALNCGYSGERISRHNMLRDAIFEVAAAAALNPVKEGRFLLPGADRRPADVFLRGWQGGQDAALDVTVTNPLKDDTRAGAAASPGHAAGQAYERKMRTSADACG